MTPEDPGSHVAVPLPAGMTFTSDVPEVGDLVAAVQRRPITSGLPGSLAGSLSGGGSGNKPLAEGAAALLDFERRGILPQDPKYSALIANWRSYYTASWSHWMGDELLSVIYGSIHMLANVAVAAWSDRNGKALNDAWGWCGIWWQMADLQATPQGYIAGIGERSGGHATTGRDRAILSYLYAMAGAPGSSIARAVTWCQAGGAGLKPHGKPPVGSWEYPVVAELLSALRLSYSRRHDFPLSGVRFEQPFYRTTNGKGDFACWLGRGFNGNTPPVLACRVLAGSDGPGAPVYLPANGGPHFRQQHYSSTCTAMAGNLVFASTMQGDGSLALPAGAPPPQVIGA